MTLSVLDPRDVIVVDRDSWCSPGEIRDALLRLWPDGPDGDPCTNDRSIIPYRWSYSLADGVDVVDQIWRGRVYCNPKFSDTGPWARKMSMHSSGVVGCVLADPSVSWWRDIWTADAICFPDHRVKFIPPPGVKPSSFSRPVALPFWAPDDGSTTVDAFERAFGSLGKVIQV